MYFEILRWALCKWTLSLIRKVSLSVKTKVSPFNQIGAKIIKFCHIIIGDSFFLVDGL